MSFRGRDSIFLMIVISMFVPRGGGLTALYELMNFLKLRNSLFGLILLFSSGLPVPIFIMRQAFLAAPKEIRTIGHDGRCQPWAIIPAHRPATGYQRHGHHRHPGLCGCLERFPRHLHHDIHRDSQLTISVGIRKVLTSGYETATANVPQLRGKFASEAADAAMLLFSAFPVVVIYALLQRWFMKGVTEGAIKF